MPGDGDIGGGAINDGAQIAYANVAVAQLASLARQTAYGEKAGDVAGNENRRRRQRKRNGSEKRRNGVMKKRSVMKNEENQ